MLKIDLLHVASSSIIVPISIRTYGYSGLHKGGGAFQVQAA